MTKEALRLAYKLKRQQLKIAEKDRLEDLILIQFQKLPHFDGNIMMTYAPIALQNEYNPYLIETWLALQMENAQFVYPKIDVETNKMQGYVITNDTAFDTNTYGIDEPISNHIIDPLQINVMIIPLLAFDTNGYRVGYGKGYYDKYIDYCSPAMIKIGCSFFDPVIIDDINQHDKKLDFCITPNKLYSF